MNLDNLVTTGQLRVHQTSASEVWRLLAAVQRNLRDSANAEISDETKFDTACKAIMQCALLSDR